jgi:two-component system cell cycle response regulator CtrA
MLILRVGPLPVDTDKAARSWALRGFALEHCETGRESLEYLRLYDYDLVLMDLDLPDMPAQEAVRLARKAGFATPSIILAERASPAVRAEALDGGADDFVLMPCDQAELFARVRAVVRRSEGHAHAMLHCGPVALSLSNHQVFVDGAEMHVSRREFSVLELLFLKRGVVLNKPAFLNHLYAGMDEPEMKTIDVMVCRLRKRLATAGVPHLIETVWGVGYRLLEPSEAAPSEITTLPSTSSDFGARP